MQVEIANMAPEDVNEDGIYSRVCTQFNWGTRWIPPFNHSMDTVNGVFATLGKSGK